MSKKVRQNYNSWLIEEMAAKPIAFNPKWARIAKSAGAGLFLSQLLYWWGKGRKPDFIYKTIAEIQEETSLTRSEQDRAIRRWKELGVLMVEKRGIPPKRHFKINIPRLWEYVEKGRANHYAESSKSDCSNVQNTTESTQENTSRDHVLHTLRRT
jgi:hypothetical protein